MTPLVAAALTLQSAPTRPAGTVGWQAGAGFALLNIGVRAFPVLPLLTGELAWERGLTDRVDLGVRYTTWLGFDHRLGPELQVGGAVGRHVALGARLHPAVRIAGFASADEGLELGGDFTTPVAALVTVSHDDVIWTLEGGFTPQFLLFERLDGGGLVDAAFFPVTVDVAVELGWRSAIASALSVRAELGVALAPDDPFGIGGVRPRLLFSGHFGRTGDDRASPPDGAARPAEAEEPPARPRSALTRTREALPPKRCGAHGVHHRADHRPARRAAANAAAAHRSALAESQRESVCARPRSPPRAAPPGRTSPARGEEPLGVPERPVEPHVEQSHPLGRERGAERGAGLVTGVERASHQRCGHVTLHEPPAELGLGALRE